MADTRISEVQHLSLRSLIVTNSFLTDFAPACTFAVTNREIFRSCGHVYCILSDSSQQ